MLLNLQSARVLANHKGVTGKTSRRLERARSAEGIEFADLVLIAGEKQVIERTI